MALSLRMLPLPPMDGWRLASLILGAEERGNHVSDGLPPSGVNEARSLQGIQPESDS